MAQTRTYEPSERETVVPARDLLPGDALGRYVVIERLGQGAMGVVYRVHDHELDRDCALKIIHPSKAAIGGPRARARLLAEARALARIAHPNVVAVYEVGVADGHLFVAMELVEGVDLAQWLGRERRPWRAVVDVFVGVAHGLDAVHRAGLVHRDVKPANILVGDDGRARIGDFGIARGDDPAFSWPGAPSVTVTEGLELETSRTAQGVVLGTPAYMAPEQHRGEVLDGAADQYALCVSLFEALYGARPFRTDTRSLARAKRTVPDPPARSGVPRWLGTIVRRGLQPDPRARFTDCRALAMALRAGPRPRLAWLVATAVLLSLVALWFVVRERPSCASGAERIAASWDGARRAELAAVFADDDEAHRPRIWSEADAHLDAWARAWASASDRVCTTAREDPVGFDRASACLDTELRQFTAVLELLAVGRGRTLERATEMALRLPEVDRCLDREALAAGALTSTDPTIVRTAAEIRGALAEARAQLSAGLWPAAAATADAAVVRARELGEGAVTAEALAIAGRIHEQTSDGPTARALLEEAFYTATSIGYDEPAAEAACDLVFLLVERIHDADAARRWAEVARAQVARLGNPLTIAVHLHNSLGTMHDAFGEYDDAVREYAAALELAEGHPEGELSTTATRINMGNVQFMRGDYAAARSTYTGAVEILRRHLGPDHPRTAKAEMSLATSLDLLGLPREAVVIYQRSATTLEAALGPCQELCNLYNRLGGAHIHAGELDLGMQWFSRAEQMCEQVDQPIGQAIALHNHAEVIEHRGSYDAALQRNQRALAVLEQLQGPDHVDVAPSLSAIARLRRLRGELELAEATLDRVQAILERTAASPDEIADIWDERGRIADARGDHDAALRMYLREREVVAGAPTELPGPRLRAEVQIGMAQHALGQARAAEDTLRAAIKAAAGETIDPALRAEADAKLAFVELARGDVSAAARLGSARDRMRAADPSHAKLTEVEALLERAPP